jgi:protein XagA
MGIVWTYLWHGWGSRRRHALPCVVAASRYDNRLFALGERVVACGSMVSRAAAALAAFAVPNWALAGAWTQPEGSGLLIGTLYGWLGDGLPWGGNPAVKQNRFDAQTYVEYGVTNEFTIFGQTALERYALSRPAENTYTGLDYSDLGMRAKLWSTGGWILSGEATLFLPGAYDSHAPAQAGDTGGAAEGRLLAGYSVPLGAMAAFFDAEFGYRLRSAGPPDEWHGDVTVGLKPTSGIMVMIQEFTTVSGASTNPGFPSWRTTVLEASIVYALGARWSVQFGLFTSVLAVRTNTAHGATLAVWRTF